MHIDKNMVINGEKLWKIKPGPVKELKPLCRKMAAEGSILLENDGVLPFSKNEKIAVFGRTQETYIKSGTGSGGLVRVEKAPCIMKSFRENGVFKIDEELAAEYAAWIEKIPSITATVGQPSLGRKRKCRSAEIWLNPHPHATTLR